MLVHGGIPLGEAWGWLRDHAKPTTPYAADQLAMCRTYEPPSKAHLKKLSKLRLAVTPARARPEPDRSARIDQTRLVAMGQAVAKLHVRDMSARPEPRQYPVTPPIRRASHREPDYAAEFAALDRKHMLEMRRTMGEKFQPTQDRIIRTWGSMEAWENAI
jgi:hypothetical protein